MMSSDASHWLNVRGHQPGLASGEDSVAGEAPVLGHVHRDLAGCVPWCVEKVEGVVACAQGEVAGEYDLPLVGVGVILVPAGEEGRAFGVVGRDGFAGVFEGVKSG